jgi:hypothetical protein
VLWKRLKSFLWRAGALVVILLLNDVLGVVEGLQSAQMALPLVALIVNEITKELQNKYNLEGYLRK